MRCAWRLDALDKWRESVDDRLASLDKELNELAMADEIADAVANKMSEHHGVYLTRVQTLVAVCALIVPPLISAVLTWAFTS